MLENAMVACPEGLWADRSKRPGFWYLVYHTLFWLDVYLSDSLETFAPPAPFTLDELSADGKDPETPYTKSELGAYLKHGRTKCRRTIDALTDDRGAERCPFDWLECTVAELHLYNLRHVQHGAAQLNLILRQETGSAPRWVKRAGMPSSR